MKKYLLLSVLLFPSLCLAQGAHRISQIIVKGNNVAANISPYAKVQVCVAGTNCQTAATVYSDVALTHTLQLPLTADESGNYDYYITSGCVDESISSPGQGTKFLPNVCPGNGQSGGGGGVNPSTVPFPICYYATAGSTCSPNAAKTDSTGNLTALSLQGNVDALLSQTTSTSNNGIFNALQANNTNVFAGTSYNPTEASEQNLSYRGIYGQTQFGVQTPLAFNTFLEDRRPTSRGWFGHNPVAGNTSPFYYVRVNQDDVQTGSVANWTSQLNETIRTCCGLYELDEATPGTGNWSNWNNEGRNFIDMAAGISQAISVQAGKFGPGDFQLFNIGAAFDGGSAVGADEGGRIFEAAISESVSPYFGTVASTLAPGATIIPINKLSQDQFIAGELRPLIISTQPGPTLHIATVTAPSGSSGQIAGTWTTTEAITPDTAICTLASAVAPPDLFKGGTTSVTVTANCPGAARAATTIACVASPVNTPEESLVTAVGSLASGVQSITLNLRHGYPAGAYVAQGPSVCKAAESLANRVSNGTTSPLRILTRVIAHQDAHTILYSSPCAGHWCMAPNGKFSTLTFPATTLSRDSSGNITMGPASISDFNEQFQGVLIRITSAVDTTYNGVYGPVTETVDPNSGAATLVMTSGVTGSAGSTTTTGVSYIVADSLFSGINQDLTLTRNGTGSTTTTTCCDSSQLINGATITISTATDTSFNGIFPGVVEVNLGGGNVSLTWPQTGGAATTSTTGPTTYFVPGSDSNTIIEYPAASTVEVQNPTTHAVDGTNVVEANQMQVNSGDTVEIQHLDEIASSVGQFIREQWTPTSASITGGMWQFDEGGSVLPDGSSLFQVNSGPPSSNYAGAGGTQVPSYSILDWNTGFSAIHRGLEMPPTDNTGTWFYQQNGCGLYVCTSPAAHFGIMSLFGGPGASQDFYQSTWHMDTGTFQETLSDRSTGNNVSFQLNANTGLQFVGPAAFSNVLDIGVTTAGLVGTQVGFTNLTLNSGQPRAAFGNGVEGDGSATIGSNQGNFPDLVAGITPPEAFGTFVAGTPGVTTYSYVCTGVTLAGAETTASPTSTTTQGNATLSVSNFLVPKCYGPPGSVTLNMYRTVGGASQGLIATGIPAGNGNLPIATIFQDTGLTANPSIQPPTANQTGNLKVFGPSTFNGPATFAGTGFPVRSGTASNTDLVGELTFAAATTVTYSFTSTGITTHPVCTVSPEATTATSGTPFVTYTGVASFTVNFPVAFTGVVGYQCLGRN